MADERATGRLEVIRLGSYGHKRSGYPVREISDFTLRVPEGFKIDG